jgi:hypothetical protein
MLYFDISKIKIDTKKYKNHYYHSQKPNRTTASTKFQKPFLIFRTDLE